MRRRWIVVAGMCGIGAVLAWRVLREDDASTDATIAEVKRVPAKVVAKGPALTPTIDELIAPPGQLRLEGRVIDEANRPVAGAHVAILDRNGKTATSDATGAFAIEGLEPRRYMLGAATDELAAAPTFVRLSETSDPVTIHMRPAGVVVVRVVDATSAAPIANATVTDYNRRRYTTDGEGVATIRGVGPDFTEVVAAAPGYARGRESTRIEPGEPAKMTIKLRRGAAVSGTVIGPDDKPVALASVYLNGPNDVQYEARADASGAWTIEGVTAGKYAVTATSETYAAAPPIGLEADGLTRQSNITVRVEIGAQLVGVVLDPAGKPVANAVVNFAGSRFSSQETTDRNGRFAFLGTPVGHFVIWGSHQARASRETTVELLDKQRVDVVVELEDSSIAGRVVDGRGEPVAGVHVLATPKIDGSRRGADSVTNAKGEFDLGGVPPGEYEIRARRGDAKSQDYSAPTEANAGNRAVEVVLQDGTTVIGRVVLDGRPMTYFAVVISEPGEMNWRQTVLVSTVRTTDGRFTQRGVASGTRDVVIAGPGFARKVIEQVDVKDGGVTDLGDIAVDRGLRIEGRVVDPSGAAVAGATVKVEQMAPVRIGGATGLYAALQGDG